MAKPFAWMVAGVVLATAGVAQAQEQSAPTAMAAGNAELPWFQRFTASDGLTERLGDSQRLLPPAWTMNPGWGVTVGVREAQGGPRAVEAVRSEQTETAVGAYYQFTPRVRVGGEVSVGAARREEPVVTRQEGNDEPAAGVRIESAFRF